MAKPQVGNSKDNEYYTPKAIIEHFGIFDYDPATVPEKAAEFNIKNYDTIQTNGLVTDWTNFKRIWCNPPFTEKHIFLEKAVKTFKKSKTEIFILFPIEFMTTKRFHEIMADQGGGHLFAKWEDKIREWAREEKFFSCFWEYYFETHKRPKFGYRKNGALI